MLHADKTAPVEGKILWEERVVTNGHLLRELTFVEKLHRQA